MDLWLLQARGAVSLFDRARAEEPGNHFPGHDASSNSHALFLDGLLAGEGLPTADPEPPGDPAWDLGPAAQPARAQPQRLERGSAARSRARISRVKARASASAL